MAIPPNAQALAQALDPTDVLDIEVTLSRAPVAPTVTPVLSENEGVASFTLALTPEAIAVGLQIKSGADGYPPPVLDDVRLTFWATIIPAMRTSPIFDGAGVTVGVELTVVTTFSPPRTKQRTFGIKVANQ